MKRSDFGPKVDGPRTHENCIAKTGVARPGKTAHDKATGAWQSKAARRERHIARDPNAK